MPSCEKLPVFVTRFISLPGVRKGSFEASVVGKLELQVGNPEEPCDVIKSFEGQTSPKTTNNEVSDVVL